jgi:hypothetical protein
VTGSGSGSGSSGSGSGRMAEALHLLRTVFHFSAFRDGQRQVMERWVFLILIYYIYILYVGVAVAGWQWGV